MLEIDLVELRLLFIEVLCMPIEVRKMEEIEIGSACFLQVLGLNESSMSFEP